MTAQPALAHRSEVELRGDNRRVLLRHFMPGQELGVSGVPRADAVIARVLALPEEDVSRTLGRTLEAFGPRHPELPGLIRENYALVAHRLPLSAGLSADRADLIGAYLTQARAIEAAALFNPSIVAHPDQSRLAAGDLRFVLSLRAVSEGHLSCVEFRTGRLSGSGEVHLDAAGPHLTSGRFEPSRVSVDFLREALEEAGLGWHAESTLQQLPPLVHPEHLRDALHPIDQEIGGPGEMQAAVDRLLHIADACYAVEFPPASDLSERVLYPSSANERLGIEDTRLTRFVDDDGSVTYLGTYTAYDGFTIHPHLLRTEDFLRFELAALLGPAAKGKGMAIFPRRIDGDLWSLTRWDRESIGVTRSPDGLRWGHSVTVETPRRPWELVQLGPCGPPVETDAGWLVVTHGVGPLRTYRLGALLLDREDPTVVLGSLADPLLEPEGDEGDGYVPNVVYSCGSIVHGGRLVIPYGCSDSRVRFASVEVEALLRRITA